MNNEKMGAKLGSWASKQTSPLMHDLIKPEALAKVKFYSKLYNQNEIENNLIKTKDVI